jgi:hypothetical protein
MFRPRKFVWAILALLIGWSFQVLFLASFDVNHNCTSIRDFWYFREHWHISSNAANLVHKAIALGTLEVFLPQAVPFGLVFAGLGYGFARLVDYSNSSGRFTWLVGGLTGVMVGLLLLFIEGGASYLWSEQPWNRDPMDVFIMLCTNGFWSLLFRGVVVVPASFFVGTMLLFVHRSVKLIPKEQQANLQ